MARIYEAVEGVLLPLGRRGENEALEVRVNIKQWIADYGNGAFGGLAQRWGEDEPYPVTITVDGDYACWLVTDIDTAIEGYGKFELDYVVGGVLAKSVTWRTKVQPSVAAPGPVPDPYESWVEDVLAAGASVLGKMDKIAGATAGNLPQMEANGTLTPTSIPAAKVMQTPTAATEGNLAAWDDALGVIDSGVAASTVLNKIDKVVDADAGNLPRLKADGSIEDSDIPAAKVMQSPSAATEGNLAAWDDALGVIDSGVAASTVPDLVGGKMNAYKSIGPALTPLELKDSYYIGIVSGLPQEIYSDGSHWRLGKYSVGAGDQLRISGYAGSSINTPLYVFLDGNGTMIERFWRQSGVDVVDVVAPDGAAILYANGNRDVESWVALYEIVTDFDAASEEVCGSMEVKLVENPENPAERGGVVVTSGDWVIDWGRNGWNNLPNLRSALFQGNPAYTGNTDFIGPYAYTMDNPGSDQGDYTWGGTSMFTTGGGHTFFDDRYTIINAYIVGDSDAKDSSWLSLTAGGAPLTPQTGDVAYFIQTAGDYRGVSYVWNGSNYVLPAHPPTKNEGVRTARCIGIKYYADGEELTADSGTVHCDTFRMVWKNRIQASNTIKWAKRTPGPDSAEPENYDIPANYSAGKECLEECCWVEFTGGGMIRCGVTFKPLASIHMGWYSGMQAQIHYLYDPDNDAPRHFDANTAKMCYIEQWSHELMEWARVTNDVTIGGVTYPAYAGDDHSVISDVTIIGKYAALDMHMDRDYGVARLRWELDAPQNHYFYAGAGTNMKGYMLLVRRDYRNPWAMPLGTLWPWRGYYHFRPTDIDRSGLIN